MTPEMREHGMWSELDDLGRRIEALEHSVELIKKCLERIRGVVAESLAPSQGAEDPAAR